MDDTKVARMRQAYADYRATEAVRNAKSSDLDFNDGFVRPEEFCSRTVLYYGSYKLVLDESDLDDIERDYRHAADTGSLESVSHCFDFLVDMLTHRMEAVHHLRDQTIISLGEDCLPRTVATRWGLKPPRVMGESTGPFDLSVHPPAAMMAMMQQKFVGYTNLEDVAFDPARNFHINKRLGILWNHEVGAHWGDGEYEKFKALYERRIANLYQSFRQDNVIAFLYSSKPIAADEIAGLAHSIGEASDGRARLAVLDSSADGRSLGDYRVAGIDVSHLHAPVPYPWYLWWSDKHFTLPGGHAWERSMVDWLKQR